MVSPAQPPVPPVAEPAVEPEGGWPAQAADKIVDVVDQVRSKTTGPALVAARGVVYGLIVAVLAVVVGVLFVIFAVRLLDELLPSGVWLAYLLLGLLFCLAGALVFRQRKPPPVPG
jgi:hypothetical protein